MRVWSCLLALAACSASKPGGHTDMPDAANSDGTTTGGDPGVERYVAHITASPSVPFGGSPYCNYKVTLKNIDLDIAIHPVDGLVAMVVADTRVEAVVGSCPYPPAPDNRQQFEHTGAAVPATGGTMFSPSLDGLTANSPLTDLTATLTRVKVDQLTAEMRWHRTDTPPPLDWTVTLPSDLTVDRVTCQPGVTSCLGGTMQGAEYACDADGIHLFRIKTCSSGCLSDHCR